MNFIDNSPVSKPVRAFVFIIGLFLLWGVASNLNFILLSDFGFIFQINSLQLGLIQVVFYAGYFVASLPASKIIELYDYKTGIIIGLLLYGVGSFLFFPATDLFLYNLFLFALFIIAVGLSFLETSTNPFVLSLGSPQSAILRLNIAQSFNPIGFFFSMVITQFFAEYLRVMPQPTEQLAYQPIYLTSVAHSVLLPFLIVGIIAIIWALLIFLLKFPIQPEEVSEPRNDKNAFQLIKAHPLLRYAILAQFFYMGAQVGIWNFIPEYATELGHPSTPINEYLIYAFVTFLIGRFLSSLLMLFFPPSKLLAIYAFISALISVAAVLVGGYSALVLIVALNFFMSLMFPTIFGLGLSGIQPAMKKGSALIVMGMIGGAVLASLMKQLNPSTGLLFTLIIPCLSFLVIFGFASRVNILAQKSTM
ncbi:MAG: L-fucose:H+ symporter permease [Bacteroidota bacterium]